MLPLKKLNPLNAHKVFILHLQQKKLILKISHFTFSLTLRVYRQDRSSHYKLCNLAIQYLMLTTSLNPGVNVLNITIFIQ